MCDNYVVDVCGSSFGVCKCGISKNEHVIIGKPPNKLTRDRSQPWQNRVSTSSNSPTSTDTCDDNCGETDSQGRSSPTPSISDVVDSKEISEEVFQQYKDLDKRTRRMSEEETIEEHPISSDTNVMLSPQRGIKHIFHHIHSYKSLIFFFF